VLPLVPLPLVLPLVLVPLQPSSPDTYLTKSLRLAPSWVAACP